VLALALAHTLGASRIKDVTTVEGGRDNQLIGYGLVVGLAGVGDSRLNYTLQTVANSLQRFGISVDAETVKSDNVAAVMITADIGPFMRPGAQDRRHRVVHGRRGVAAKGGVLMQTPLVGGDGTVYAVAQGPIAVGGFIGGSGGPGGATIQKNHPTVGTITGGAIVEREISTQIFADSAMNLLLLNPDYSTAVRTADSINSVFPGSAQATDAATVNVKVPEMFDGQEVNFLAIVGCRRSSPDTLARIIINERNGHHRRDALRAAVERGRQPRLTGHHDIQLAGRQPATAPGGWRADGRRAADAGQRGRGARTLRHDRGLPHPRTPDAGFEHPRRFHPRDDAILQTMKKAGALQVILVIN
jgi:flagellar P-ring protein precursor FlgI